MSEVTTFIGTEDWKYSLQKSTITKWRKKKIWNFCTINIHLIEHSSICMIPDIEL